MRLRRQSRFRSLLKTALSILILAGLAVGAVWKFQLWPIELIQPNTGELAESEELFSFPTNTSGDDAEERLQESAQDGASDDTEAESIVFQNQSEPDIDEEAVSTGSDSSFSHHLQRQSPGSDSAFTSSSHQQADFDERTETSPFNHSSINKPNSISEKPKRLSSSSSSATPKESSPIVQMTNQVAQKKEKPSSKPDLDEIDRLMNAGNYVAAHRELSKIYWSRPDFRDAIQERIETTARSIYFDPQPHYMDPHVIQPGDQLRLIARKYQVPWQYLAKLNRTEPRKIRAGQKLKVIQGPFSAFVDLSDFELTVHAHGYFVARYPVGIGKDGTTPLGKLTVEEKLEDPTYYGPEGVIANDDPQNPLGERWIDLGDSYGIHGTIDPDSIGRAESRGCIRMRNEDVEEVYDLLTEGSEVVIRR